MVSLGHTKRATLERAAQHCIDNHFFFVVWPYHLDSVKRRKVFTISAFDEYKIEEAIWLSFLSLTD